MKLSSSCKHRSKGQLNYNCYFIQVTVVNSMTNIDWCVMDWNFFFRRQIRYSDNSCRPCHFRVVWERCLLCERPQTLLFGLFTNVVSANSDVCHAQNIHAGSETQRPYWRDYLTRSRKESSLKNIFKVCARLIQD